MTTESAGPGLRELDPELEKMLRDLRERGCKRDEPCGVHDTPLWTCGLCLHNVLERVEDAHIRAALAAAVEPQPFEVSEDGRWHILAVARQLRVLGDVDSPDGRSLRNLAGVLQEAVKGAALAEAKDDAPGHCENCRAAVPLTTVHLCATCLPAAPSEHRATLADAGRSSLPGNGSRLREVAEQKSGQMLNDYADLLTILGRELNCSDRWHRGFTVEQIRKEADTVLRATASLPLRTGEPQ